MPSTFDITTWLPLIGLIRAGDSTGEPVAGHVSTGGWSVPEIHHDHDAEWAAIEHVQRALTTDGRADINFLLDGPALHLIDAGPAMDGLSARSATVLLVEGAVAEPWRRLPAPVPGATESPSADPALLERHLRERLPELRGATEAEIAAAQTRLGVTLPEELKALHRVIRLNHDDPLDGLSEVLGLYPLGLDGLRLADAASRPCWWEFAAMEAAITGPDDRVQGLVGSPGWIAFAENGGGDTYAVDLTPGPRGHRGQVILISHEEDTGAVPIAASLTDLLVHRREYDDPGPTGDRAPVVVYANDGNLVVHPDLEALNLGNAAGPKSIAPLAGLPRLRTFVARAGSLADPREVSLLAGLEYLELDLADWRAVLDAGAVPSGLAAAGVRTGHPGLPAVMDLSNELLARWERPLITRTTLRVPA